MTMIKLLKKLHFQHRSIFTMVFASFTMVFVVVTMVFASFTMVFVVVTTVFASLTVVFVSFTMVFAASTMVFFSAPAVYGVEKRISILNPLFSEAEPMIRVFDTLPTRDIPLVCQAAINPLLEAIPYCFIGRRAGTSLIGRNPVWAINSIADLLPQNSVFDNQIFNSVLLLLIDPASQNEKKHLPGMQNRFHADAALFS
jgi:hypothetical protein